MSKEERQAHDRAECAEYYGYKPNTPEFERCLEELARTGLSFGFTFGIGDD